MNYLDIDNIIIDGVDFDDYPDFCDAYIQSADYKGIPMNEDQLNEINEDCDFVYESIMNQLF